MKRSSGRRCAGMILALLALVMGCANQHVAAGRFSARRPGNAVPPQSAGRRFMTEEDKIRARAKRLLGGMTLEQKVGQMFFVRPESLSARSGSVTQWSAECSETLQKYPPGGVALFGQNIADPAQLRALVADMQSASVIPLLIGVDEEGGRVARIAEKPAFDVVRYQSMAEVGRTQKPEAAQEAYAAIGAYLTQYGVNIDFAPVADVNTNPRNTVIGNRAFGSDPVQVAPLVRAAVEGLRQSGVLSCIKHYPGHGDTRNDTHNGAVTLEKTWEELKGCELIPFIAALDSTDMVMASHISVPAVDPTGLPASLSQRMIEEKLRGELGYGGVVITDALEMGAIAQHYTPAESAVKAVSAGVDILLMPSDYPAAYTGLVQAVRDGRVPETRIDESVLRILSLKIRRGVIP